MDSSEFSSVRYAMSDGCGGWTEVKPLGGPVTIHAVNADAFVDAMHGVQESSFECTMKLEHFNMAFLDEVAHNRPTFDLFYKRDVIRMSYPATVRQAKARHKGNRGNRRREYETRVVQCVMRNVRIENETA